MNLLRFSIILLLIVGLAPLASGEDIVHTHSLSGTYDEINTSEFGHNELVTDVVTSTSTSPSNWLWFVWKEGNDVSQFSKTIRNNGLYINHFNPYEGNWRIEAYETSSDNTIELQNNRITYSSDDLLASSYSDYFIVSPLPEFTFGSLIAMFLAGAIYLMIRRNVDRSTNVN